MKHGRMIYVLGDVHANFAALNDFINKKIRLDRSLCAIMPYWKKEGDDLQVVILQCGDFAWFWPGYDNLGKIKNGVDFLPGGHVPIYWVGGNHEDWDALDRLGTGITEIDKELFYCAFGSTLQIAPDVTVLFAGGAESHDKDWRLREMARGAPKIWWAQEGVSEEDMYRLDNVARADWVVSHTAPNAFDVAAKLGWRGDDSWSPSRGLLEEILVKYHPKNWFFGHFHHHMTGRIDGCDWECLSSIDSGEKAWAKYYLQWDD